MSTSASQAIRNGVLGGFGAGMGGIAFRVFMSNPVATAAVGAVGATYACISSPETRKIVVSSVMNGMEALGDEVRSEHSMITAAAISGVAMVLSMAGAPVVIPSIVWGASVGLFAGHHIATKVVLSEQKERRNL